MSVFNFAILLISQTLKVEVILYKILFHQLSSFPTLVSIAMCGIWSVGFLHCILLSRAPIYLLPNKPGPQVL